MDSPVKSGISLLELMIALGIFAAFGVAFVSGVGQNIFSSDEMRSEIKMVELAEMKINELIVDPPALRETLTEQVQDIKEFEDFPDYTYTVELRKFIIPDLSSFKDDDQEQEEDGKEDVHGRFFAVAKQNFERMIWQMSVTVKHKASGRSQSFSTWLHNHKAGVSLGGL